jgi:hypothetical protein
LDLGDGEHIWIGSWAERSVAPLVPEFTAYRYAVDFDALACVKDDDMTHQCATDAAVTNLAPDYAGSAWFLEDFLLYQWELSGDTPALVTDWTTGKTLVGQPYVGWQGLAALPETLVFSGTPGVFHFLRTDYLGTTFYPHLVSEVAFESMGEKIVAPAPVAVMGFNMNNDLIYLGPWGDYAGQGGRWKPEQGDGWWAPDGGIRDAIPQAAYWFLPPTRVGAGFYAAGYDGSLIRWG